MQILGQTSHLCTDKNHLNKHFSFTVVSHVLWFMWNIKKIIISKDGHVMMVYKIV